MNANVCPCADRFATEIVWDAGLSGTGTTQHGRSLVVSAEEGWAPEHLLLLAAEGCFMRTLLALSADAGIRVLGYVSSAHLQMPEDVGAAPAVTLVPCVLVSTTSDAVGIAALRERALERSPIAQLLGARLLVTIDVRVVPESVAE